MQSQSDLGGEIIILFKIILINNFYIKSKHIFKISS